MRRYAELSLAAQTAYAQLTDAAGSLELGRDVGHLQGSFGRKTVRGSVHWYFGFRDVDGRVRHLYVGPDSPSVRALVERAHNHPRPMLAPLAKAAVALGCGVSLPKHVRVIRRLSEYGFFRAGGVLIGTHAFIAMANMLGVRWQDSVSTTDVDLAHAGKNISLALPADITVDVHHALLSFEQGFLPLVQFSGGTGASYRHQREADFQLDFVTTLHRGQTTPYTPANLNVALQPLKFMEFSLEGVTQAVLFDANGGAVMVTIPAPARYAVHKLLVYGERSPRYRTKASKDLLQSAALFAYFIEHNLDEIETAWADALSRGPGWRKRAMEGLEAMKRAVPDVRLSSLGRG